MKITVIGYYFFFNDTATTEIYTLSLHDALPISEDQDLPHRAGDRQDGLAQRPRGLQHSVCDAAGKVLLEEGERLAHHVPVVRSEEHTSELQSRQYLVCRLLLEKKKKLHIELAIK